MFYKKPKLIEALTSNNNHKRAPSLRSNLESAIVYKFRTWLPATRNLRQEQMKELSSAPHEVGQSKAEKSADLHLSLSVASLGLTVAGSLFFAPFSLLGIAVLGYLWFPVFQVAYKALRTERRITIEVLDCIMTPIMLLGGYHILAAFVYILYYFSDRMLVKTENHTRKALVNVFGEQPRSIWILKEGVEVEIPFEALRTDDIVVLHAGEMIPADGVIMAGMATVDQRVLTGESQPIEKGVDDTVFAATVILSGQIHVRGEKIGAETVAAQIGQILADTEEYQTLMRSQAMEWADGMVPLRIILTSMSFALLGTAGGLAVLNARFGYHMRIIGPLGMLNFLQIAAQRGILIKDGRSLELLNKVDTVVFDKTGTLTEEQPSVGALYSCNGITQNELLQYAATAEYKQTHPIARAILQAASDKGVTQLEISNAHYEIGYGIKVHVNEQQIQVGSGRFMEMEDIIIPSEMLAIETAAHELGYSLIYVAIDGQLGGAIELRPTVRPEAKEIIAYFKARQIATYIISGDHEKPTRKLAEVLAVDHYFAETLPENKADIVEALQNEDRFICFVGDGINDAIALKKAQVSISLRGASTIATDTAQIILMDQTLNQLTRAFEIADEFAAHMHSAFLTTVIPQTAIVGGAYLLHFGVVSSITLNLMGLFTGVAHAMIPLNRHKNAQLPDNKRAILTAPKKDVIPQLTLPTTKEENLKCQNYV